MKCNRGRIVFAPDYSNVNRFACQFFIGENDTDQKPAHAGYVLRRQIAHRIRCDTAMRLVAGILVQLIGKTREL